MIRIILVVLAAAAAGFWWWQGQSNQEPQVSLVTSTQADPKPPSVPQAQAPQPNTEVLIPAVPQEPGPTLALQDDQSPDNRGYGDLTAYEAYSESQLVELMTDTGDPDAASAFVQRLESRNDQGTIASMTYMYQLTGSSAAINRMLSWSGFEWERPEDPVRLSFYSRFLGDQAGAINTDGLSETQVIAACEEALAEFQNNNEQRSQLGWDVFIEPDDNDCQSLTP